MAGLLGLAVWLSYRGIRAEPARGKRAVLLSLRVVAALALFALLLEPGIELRAETRVRARVALLLDTSRSMRFPATPGGPSRAEAMLRWLHAQQAELGALAGRFQLDAYGFDRELQPLDAGRLAQAADPRAAGEALATGPATDLLSALGSAASGGAGGRPLAGIVVASDGADNADLSGGVTPGAVEQLRRLGAPVFALPVGGEAGKDLAIDAVRVDDFAFVRSPVAVDVTVSVRGFPATDVPLVLEREGQVVAQKTVHLSGTEKTTARLTFVPDRTGKFAFTVAAPVYEGEAVAQNNRRAFVLQVIRDRVRVLLVVGRPSWDVRFLRQLLKRDPNVDLISFFILRTPGDDPHSSQDELSLIPFPTQEIFQEQLKTFDLVIFQDFNHRPYRMSQYLDGIAAYVRDGGAFAMIGGEQSFSAGDYAGTAIEDILPVALLPAGVPPSDEVPAQVQPTDAGRRHPVVELASGAAQSAQAWLRLPKLPGLNGAGAPRNGGQLLLQATDGRPVLAVADVGRGRSLALLTDSSWMWSFVAAGQELGPRAYETFWHGALRWLVRDPALTPMRATAEKAVVEPGEAPALDVQARGADYGAAAGAQLQVSLSSADDPAARPVASAVAGPDGTARIPLPALGPGAYKAKVVARQGGQVLGESEEAFVVAPSSRELAEAAPRPELLKAVAEATRGRLFEEGDRLSRLPFRDPGRVEVGQRASRPLWDTWKVLVALTALVAAEWSLRRRWGYA